MNGFEYGDPRLPERFWDKVHPEPNTACWLWGGTTYKAKRRNSPTLDSYGAYRHEGRTRAAHVVLMEVAGRHVPGLDVRHRCAVRWCVNPDHLETGTRAENMADAKELGQTKNGFSYATHCVNGHPFDEENTHWRSTGGRTCRACQRARDLVYNPRRGPATHCRRGHEFTSDNTYTRPDTGTRMCRTCSRDRGRQCAS